MWAVGLRGQCAEGVCVLASCMPKEGRGKMFGGESGRFPAWEGCGGDHFRSVPFGVAAKVQNIRRCRIRTNGEGRPSGHFGLTTTPLFPPPCQLSVHGVASPWLESGDSLQDLPLTCIGSKASENARRTKENDGLSLQTFGARLWPLASKDKPYCA